jgi:exopolysaccharide biosynthesis polyprenyl glycosylphosphotransferase
LAYDGIVIDLHVHEDENHVLNALANASLHDVAIIHAASVLEQYRGQTDLDYVAEEGLYDLSSHKIYPATKRGIEVLFTLLLSPFILLIAAVAAAAVKVSSKGPVIYSQDRIGRNGKFFTLYKFRSMTMGSERYGPQFAVKQDKRVTKVGTFIRKFRIDEIPQFWNVLKGDMSLIGPRPEQKMFVELFNDEIPFYSYRHKVRPGITGWAQIKDGYADGVKSTKRKLEYDFYYIKNLSFSLDLLIIYATIKTILTGFGSR